MVWTRRHVLRVFVAACGGSRLVSPRQRYGALTVERHQYLCAQGVYLHVFHAGRDVTIGCLFADDRGEGMAVRYTRDAQLSEAKQLDLRERWRYVNMLKGHFCERFAAEIVPLLRTRKKWTNQRENVAIGDICLEIDENSPRTEWRMVRITKIYPSEDGLVRRVEIRSSGDRLYDRPIARLIPIVQD
jgi:hypothetical protein